MAVFWKSLIHHLTWKHVLRQWLLFILLAHEENVEIKITNLPINEYSKLFPSTNHANSSKCQWYITTGAMQEQHILPTEAWGLLCRLCVPKFWVTLQVFPACPHAHPTPVPPNFFLHPTHLSVRNSSLKFLKPPFYLHTQISTLNFALWVQGLPSAKIPGISTLLLPAFFHSQGKWCVCVQEEGYLHLEESSSGLTGNALKSQFLFHGRREAIWQIKWFRTGEYVERIPCYSFWKSNHLLDCLSCSPLSWEDPIASN